jgi:hypothetical protein
MGSTKGRPSPATVLSIVALVVALGGTAIAATALTKKEKKQVSRIAAGQVNQLAPNLSVARANSANAANTANTATNAGNADALQGSSLAQVAPGSFGIGITCSPTATFTTCATAPLTLNRTADVFVIATAQWYSPDAAGTSVRARCQVRRDVTASTGNHNLGSVAHQTDSDQTSTIAFTGVFFDAPAGSYNLEVRCIEDAGNVELALVELLAFVGT